MASNMENREVCGLCSRITVVCMTTTGLIFSIMAATSCEFYEYYGRVGNREGSGGLFRLTDPETGECVEFSLPSYVQPTFLTARTCAALGSIFGLNALVFVLIEFCCCKICCSRVILSIFYMVAYICQAITFVAFGNQTYCGVSGRCYMGRGAVWSLIAVILYFVSSCIVCCTPKSEPLFCEARDESTKTVTAHEQSNDRTVNDIENVQSAATTEPDVENSTPANDSEPDAK